ncbi:MAG TPA: galactose-1-phosphate uridylyltransferase [Polyangiaceae bacterium]
MTWEERWHPLREEWVIVAAHRQERPWLGNVVGSAPARLPRYVPDCYLCPGNSRVSGLRNADYRDIFVFDNDHPCVSPDAPAELAAPGIFRSRRAEGIARVLCYSPRHDLTLAELGHDEIVGLLRAWQEQYQELGARPEVSSVLTFENKGEVVGVSNPHPHCQIYATNFVWKTIETEVGAGVRYFADTGRVLFQDVLRSERDDGRRILYQDETAIAFVPYFARYAYETYVAPLRTHPSIASLDESELSGFARALREVLVRYDNLWKMPFPYVLVLHQAPTDGRAHAEYHFHVEIHPPLRKPNLLKYLAGPEIGGGSFLSDTAPEATAAELRAASGAHYRAGA